MLIANSLTIDRSRLMLWPQTNRTEGGEGSGCERRAEVQKMKGW